MAKKHKQICEACAGVRLQVVSETGTKDRITKVYKCPRCGAGYTQAFDRGFPDKTKPTP